MDELTRDIHGEILWCMIFTDDIIPVDETRDGVMPNWSDEDKL